jgi:hypothetical protein
MFQDDRACAATAATMNAKPSNAHLKLAALRVTLQLLRCYEKSPAVRCGSVKSALYLKSSSPRAAAVHACTPLARKKGCAYPSLEKQDWRLALFQQPGIAYMLIASQLEIPSMGLTK